MPGIHLPSVVFPVAAMPAGLVWAALRHSARVCAATNALGFAVTAVTQSHRITDLTGTAAFAASALATRAAAARSVAGAQSPSPMPAIHQNCTPALPNSLPKRRVVAYQKPASRPAPPCCRALGEPLLAPTRGALLAGCVSLWALRLGGYLFYRVMQVKRGVRRLAGFFSVCAFVTLLLGGGCRVGSGYGGAATWGPHPALPVCMLAHAGCLHALPEVPTRF